MAFKKRFIFYICYIPLCLLTLIACENAQTQGPVPTSTTLTRETTMGTPQVQPTDNIKQGQGIAPPARTAQIKLDKIAYSTHDIIKVTVTNRQTQSMYITSPQANCSLVRIEIQINKKWLHLGRCVEVQASPIRRLAAGANIQQSLRPEMISGSKYPAATVTATWQPGIYRIVFEYSETPDPDSIGGTKSVTSYPFTIS